MGSLNINKQKTAFVVIDLQKGIAQNNFAPYQSSLIIANAAAIADAFRKNGMAVVLVNVRVAEKERLNVNSDTPFPPRMGAMNKDYADIVPELGPKEGDILVTKKQWGAFYGTDLELQLRRRGIDTIVICGISTTHGVESTSRFAYEYGFQQIFVEDAMSSSTEAAHKGSIEVFKRMGRVRTAKEVLDELSV
jgi:nicotinamidase-related amidase